MQKYKEQKRIICVYLYKISSRILFPYESLFIYTVCVDFVYIIRFN